MNRTLKLFGRFFVFAIAITIFSFSIFTFSSTQVYAEGSFVFTNHLELGVVSNDVKELQTLLNTQGYNVGIPDGKFGPTTKAQVILFQKANGLTPDGIVGEEVRAFLNGTSTITPTTKTTTTPKATTITSTTPTSLDRTLKLSMTGNDVKVLQTFLNNSGYNVGIADGSFGPKTEAQVKLFQTANNLTPDGSVGPMTKAIMGGNLFVGSTSQTTVGCTSGALFNTMTGQSCAVAPIISLGCTPGALFSTVTGTSCGTLSVLPAGCTSSSLFSTTSGVSCTTGLSSTPVIKYSGGGSSGPSIQKVSSTISGVTIPAQGATPVATLSGTTQYSAVIAWTGTPTIFAASTEYTATITLTAKSGYTLSGVTANYFTVAGATATNDINSGVITAVFSATPLIQLTISDPTLTTTKAYNGNTTAVVTAGTLAGIIGTEDVTVSAVATYDTKNIGTGKTITVVYTLDGDDAGNYIKPADYIVATGEITIIPLTISAPSLLTSLGEATKEYDRTTTAQVTPGSLIGKVSGDDVIVSAVANYDTINRGDAKTITVVYSITGADAGNYTKPVDKISYTGVISKKQLTVSAPSLTTTKTYNQSNTVAIVSYGTLTGVAPTEDVSLLSTTATYNNASAGSGKTITVVYAITGADIANYIIPVNYTTTGTINTIQLTIPNPTLTLTKAFNGTTTAAVTPGSLVGVLANDTVSVTAAANYDNINFGTNKTITTVYTLSGAQSGNYSAPVNYIVTNGIITIATIANPTIAGVTAPVVNATPVTTVTQTAEYTGTITWSPTSSPFVPGTVYTATITLTPKTGYTVTGITQDSFTVSGASVTNDADSGVITAVFGATASTIATPAIAGVTAPVTGATPTATITATDEYTATISWSPTGTFSGGQVYTATITLTPQTGYTTTGITLNQFTVDGATATNSINSGIITAVFPATVAWATAPSSIVLAPGTLNPVGGAGNVFIPTPGTTNATGYVTSWVTGTKESIKFTVTNAGSATSSILINSSEYTSGDDYIIPSASPLTIIVTTIEDGKTTAVRTFTVSVTSNPGLGDLYQGGKVAYILQPSDTGYNASIMHGLIAAVSDQSTGIRWYNGSNTTTGATGTAIGTGLANTEAIITNQGPTATTYAAGLARAYTGGDYTDWYLPSKDELNKLWGTRTLVGGFSTSTYWSSSEVSSTSAWFQNFTNGNQLSNTKSTTNYVRAVRAF